MESNPYHIDKKLHLAFSPDQFTGKNKPKINKKYKTHNPKNIK
jgi:hypothetical protein